MKYTNRLKESHYCNIYDREIVEALERLFILEPEKTGDFEDDETDRQILKILRYMLIFVVVSSIMRVLFALEGEGEIISGFHKMTTSFFFGSLFFMLHIETKNQSRILLLLTVVSFWFGIW